MSASWKNLFLFLARSLRNHNAHSWESWICFRSLLQSNALHCIHVVRHLKRMLKKQARLTKPAQDTTTTYSAQFSSVRRLAFILPGLIHSCMHSRVFFFSLLAKPASRRLKWHEINMMNTLLPAGGRCWEERSDVTQIELRFAWVLREIEKSFWE